MQSFLTYIPPFFHKAGTQFILSFLEKNIQTDIFTLSLIKNKKIYKNYMMKNVMKSNIIHQILIYKSVCTHYTYMYIYMFKYIHTFILHINA
jgi:hypothetical protein